MNEHDLLEAIGNLPDGTVKKYALPETKHQDNEIPATAAGKERIKMKQTGEKTKQPLRIGKLGIAAAVALCIGLNGALIYGISQMKKDPGMTPGMAMSDVIDRGKVYIGTVRAMPTGVGLELHNETDEHYDVVKAEVWQNGEKLEDARPAQLSLPSEQDADVFFKTFTFDQIPAGQYTLMTYGEDGVTVSAFGSVDFEVSEKFADMVWYPDVSNMTREDAEAKLNEMGLPYAENYTLTNDAGITPGDVVHMDNLQYEETEMPDGSRQGWMYYDGNGYWVRKGQIPNIWIAQKDGETVLVPDMTGWDYETAKQQILGLGLYVDKRSSYDDEVPEGKVISMDVGDGETTGSAEAKAGSYVRIVVSLGPNPGTVSVPDFTRMNVDEALEVAQGVNLVLNINSKTFDEPDGTVVSQDVKAGEEVAEGTVITLDVSGEESYTIRLEFHVPSDKTGSYHMELRDSSGVLCAKGESFRPNKTSGKTNLVAENPAAEDKKVTAYAVNEDTGAEAVFGTYMLHFGDFGNGTGGKVETISEDMNAAFAEIG